MGHLVHPFPTPIHSRIVFFFKKKKLPSPNPSVAGSSLFHFNTRLDSVFFLPFVEVTQTAVPFGRRDLPCAVRCRVVFLRHHKPPFRPSFRDIRLLDLNTTAGDPKALSPPTHRRPYMLICKKPWIFLGCDSPRGRSCCPTSCPYISSV